MNSLPSIFCLLFALQWLFIMFFQDSVIVICKRGKSDQATLLGPEILFPFYCFHFLDETSYLFVHYGHTFLLVCAQIFNSCFKDPLKSASSNTCVFLGFVSTDICLEYRSHFPISSHICEFFIVYYIFLMKHYRNSGFCYFP